MVFVIAKTGMALTFNYQGQGQGHFWGKKNGRKYHVLKGSFYLLIRNDKSLRVNETCHQK